MLELRQRGMQQERAVQDMTPTRSFLAILVISLSFLGVPHGATDHLVGDKIFKHSFPNTWLCVFVVVYLAMMGMVIASWFLAPVASLAAFLFLSVIHWGLGDTESDLVPLTLQPLEVLIRGSIPILLPSVLHQEAVSQIFSFLVGMHGDTSSVQSIVNGMSASMSFFIFGWAICFSYHLIEIVRYTNAKGVKDLKLTSKQTRHLISAVELASLTALCSLCPPLVSFMLYFCVWHSCRHILCVAASTFDNSRCIRALMKFGLHALPFTIATLLMAGVWYFKLEQTEWDQQGKQDSSTELKSTLKKFDALSQVIFVGLSAVTVPHMIVTELSMVRQRALEGNVDKVNQ
uniref:Beta-carotene 15,15'-dioxygenase n=1 Tax=Hanusia phi TaxID=3032 RepID=A0A7S0NC91_9CRYP